MSETKTAHQASGLFRQASAFAFSSQITQLITLVAAILSRRFLGPTQVGIWATLQIVVEYSKYSTMGALYSTAREIPYLLGKGKKAEADKIKNIVFTVTLFNSTVIGIAILIFALATEGRWGMEMTYGLMLASLIVILQRLSDFSIGLVRCYKQFMLASQQMIWSAVVNVMLVAFLSYRFKIYGFIWALILSLAFNILYIQLNARFRIRTEFDYRRVRELLNFGLPMMVIGLLTTVWRSIDRMMIANQLGFEALGFYSVAFMVSVYIQSFFNSIAVVLFPHLQERFSMNDDPKDVKMLIEKASHAYALVMPAIIGLAWVCGPYFISLLLPKFIPGIQAMKMLSLSMFFLSLTQPFTDFLITIRKHLFLFPMLGVTVLFAFFFTRFAIALNWGITGVATAAVLSALFNFTVVYFFALRYLRWGRESVENFLIFAGCGLCLFLALSLADLWFPETARSIKQLMCQLLLFAIFYAGLAIYLECRFSIVTVVLRKLLIRETVPVIAAPEVDEY